MIHLQVIQLTVEVHDSLACTVCITIIINYCIVHLLTTTTLIIKTLERVWGKGTQKVLDYSKQSRKKTGEKTQLQCHKKAPAREPPDANLPHMNTKNLH